MLSYMAKTFFAESPVLAYPIFALLIFLVVFVIIAVKTWRGNPAELERLARMPLDEPVRASHEPGRSRQP